MCVKCGINSCGCSGKAADGEPILTGDIVVGPEDASFSCAANPDSAIYPGDSLNLALQKIMAQACLASSTPSPLLRVVGTPVSFSGDGVIAGSEIIIPEGGWYNIRIQLDVDIDIILYPDTYQSDFSIGLNGSTALGTNNYAAEVLMTGLGVGVGSSQRYQNISLENVVQCVTGDVISLVIANYSKSVTIVDDPGVVFSIIAEYVPNYVLI